MTIKRWIALISILFLIIPLPAQETKDAPYTLEDCIATALRQNPLVLSSHQRYQASLARINQAKAFSQPSLNYDSDIQPSFFNFKDSEETCLGLSQLIEFPGKRSLRGKIATRESEENQRGLDILKLDIIFQVKQAFFSLLLAQERLKYTEQNLNLSEDFLQKADLKYETGDVAKVEVLRAKVEASKAANEVRIATNEIRLAKAYLNFLLARKKYAPLEIQGNLRRAPLSLDEEQLKALAITSRPELKKLQHSLQKEILMKKQGYMNYLPDFNLGVNRHRIEGEGSWDVTLSFPIPLFFWQPAKGEIAETKANIESIKKEIVHIQNSILLEVKEAYTNASAASSQIRLFEKEILTQAEEAYNMFLFSYQEGEISGIELIEARRTLIEARMSYADVLYKYAAALAALEKSIGQKLEGE